VDRQSTTVAPLSVEVLIAPRARLEPIRAALADHRFHLTSLDEVLDPRGLEAAETERDALVLAASAPSGAGANLVRLVRRRWPATPVVVIARSVRDRTARRLFEAGAVGLVLESDVRQRLIPTIQAVCVGQVVVPADQRAEVDSPALSYRERQVLGHVLRGRTNGEIATRLFLSESTIKMHLSSAFSKLGVRSRAEATRLLLDPDVADRHGVLPPGAEPTGASA
jgi:two-component system response regulator DesR